ncbi:hypothetical protein HID58_007202, partial [Brassica napus]
FLKFLLFVRPPICYGDRLPVRRDLFQQPSVSSGMVGRLSTLGLIFPQDCLWLLDLAALFSIELLSAYGLSEILESPLKFFSVDDAASVGDFPVGDDRWLLDLRARVPHTLTW